MAVDDYQQGFDAAEAIGHADAARTARHYRGRIAELEAALAPFAKQLEWWGEPALESERPPDGALAMIAPRLWNNPNNETWGKQQVAAFSYGDLRRARNLLKR